MLVVLPSGTTATRMRACPELRNDGSRGEGPYDSKLRSSVAVKVPVARTVPSAVVCVKVAPPVADLGCSVRVPVPVSVTRPRWRLQRRPEE